MSALAVIAHVAGLPVEELVLPLAAGAGTLWAVVRAWTSARLAPRHRLERRAR